MLFINDGLVGEATIAHFEPGIDKLLFEGLDSFSDLSVTSVGLDTRVTFSADGISSNSVTLAGVGVLASTDVLFSV